MAKSKFFVPVLLLACLQVTSSFAQGSVIGGVEKRWANIYYCKLHLFADPEVRSLIYQNDIARAEATESFIRKFAEEEFGRSDAEKLEVTAILMGGTWREKVLKGLSRNEKIAALDYCRNTVFRK